MTWVAVSTISYNLFLTAKGVTVKLVKKQHSSR